MAFTQNLYERPNQSEPPTALRWACDSTKEVTLGKYSEPNLPRVGLSCQAHTSERRCSVLFQSPKKKSALVVLACLRKRFNCTQLCASPRRSPIRFFGRLICLHF